MKQSKIWANEFHSKEVSFLASHSYPGVSYTSQIQIALCTYVTKPENEN